MNSKFNLLILTFFLTQGITTICKHSYVAGSKKVIAILEDEKWWGGAVCDGPNMPFTSGKLVYDQKSNCKDNQAAPLFISSKGRFIWSEKPLNIEITKTSISFDGKGGDVISGKNGSSLKEVFLQASKQFFAPSGKTPDPLMFTNPQYNTWIELQYNQNETDILKYAQAIIENGCPPGVLMIDDNWQIRYGPWKFDCEKFTNPKGMIEKLHAMGFKVMLWVVPFVSSDSPIYRKLAAQKMLLFDNPEKTRADSVRWWNGVSGLLDLSNHESDKWFREQLANLVKDYGVDGFKLDAGDPCLYLGTYSLKDFSPNDHCEAYAKIGLSFRLNELRACWKMAGQPLVERLRDKAHSWDDVRVLIPDMIGLGMIGHQFGCPDLIGGGEFTSFQDNSIMDEELVV